MPIIDKIGKNIEKLLIYYTNYKIIKNYIQKVSLIFTTLVISKFFYLKNYIYTKMDLLKKIIFRELVFFKKNCFKTIIYSKKSYYNLEKEKKKNFEKQKSIHSVLRKMIVLMQKEKEEGKIKTNLEYSKITIEKFKKIQKIIYEITHKIKNFSQNKRKRITKTFKKTKSLVFIFIGILIYKFLKFIINKD
jgi:hypothetical protein